MGGGCPEPEVYGTFDTQDATATAPSDYQAVAGETGFLCDNSHGDCPARSSPEKQVVLPITDGTGAEAAVESFWFRITGTTRVDTGQPIGVAEPSSAPVHVIDDDGADRFSLEPTMAGGVGVAYPRSESFSSLRIPVFRAGPANSPSEIAYEVTPSGTNPATPDLDYQVAASGSIPFAAGERIKTLAITIVNDDIVEDPETFEVVLADTQPLDPNRTTVTIVDNDLDTIAPKSWFHHPRHRLKYQYGDYRLREMHVFFRDEGGSEVVRVQMALRKRLLDGSCRWFVGGSWPRGQCNAKRWMEMKLDFDLYLKRFPNPLTPSVGTNIRNYTAWCKATDGAGNVQTTFLHDRTGTSARGDGNWSTFEVKQR